MVALLSRLQAWAQNLNFGHRRLMGTVIAVLIVAMFLLGPMLLSPAGLPENLRPHHSKPHSVDTGAYHLGNNEDYHGVPHKGSDAEHEPSLESWHSENSKPVVGPLDEYASKVFMMLKTGHRVLRSRFPVHLRTTLPRWPHCAVYADIDEVVNGVQIHDVFAKLPQHILNGDQMLEYRVLQTLRAEQWEFDSNDLNVDNGWASDKYKNMPMLAMAYQQAHDLDIEWFVFIDDDTFVFQGGLLNFLREMNPDEPIYTGSPAYMSEYAFAHGGSGVVISREAMSRLFGPDPFDEERINDILARYADAAVWNCCGDAVVAEALLNEANITMYMPYGGSPGMSDGFQGAAFDDFRVEDGAWCLPMYTWHHLSPREVEELFNYEEKKIGDREVLYSEAYRDLILPHIVDERPNWRSGARTWRITAETVLEYSIDDIIEANGGNPLWPNATLADCKRACECVEHCLVWSWWEGECNLERWAVVRGSARNQYLKDYDLPPVTSGWMIDRIRERRLHAECDPLEYNETTGEWNDTPETSEGWYVRKLQKEGYKLDEIG